MGREPVTLTETFQQWLPEDIPILATQVTSLAESSKIPGGIVKGVAVKVMDGKSVTSNGVVNVPTSLATIVVQGLYVVGSSRPVWIV